ncbi:MAG: response regulator [Spirochaetales bacterium]|jgi:YesN/AraC family two-component response regulator|nr:response regulator [Spirochaetales bacterium]
MYKLLIADDEEIEREAIKMFVLRAGLPVGEIFETGGGNETVTAALKHSPDIMILDINMPGISGLDALEKIRGAGCRVKTVISTAYDQFDFAVRALQLGAADFLVKPVKQDILVSCLTHIIEYLDSEVPAVPRTAFAQDSRWGSGDIAAKLMTYMENNFGKKITLDDIAESCGYSKFHASRIFKAATGKTIIEYLIHIRIKNARQLLAATNHSIKEISAITGFSDPNYFTWTFRKYTNLSPGQYRSNILE